MSDDEEVEQRPKRCRDCGAIIEKAEQEQPPGMPERCADCAHDGSVNVFSVARRWPRVMRAVQAHVQSDDKLLVARYVSKAVKGEKLYTRIVREAFARRHDERKKRTI